MTTFPSLQNWKHFASDYEKDYREMIAKFAAHLHAAGPDAGFTAYHTRMNPSPVGHIGKYEDLVVTLGKTDRVEFVRANGYRRHNNHGHLARSDRHITRDSYHQRRDGNSPVRASLRLLSPLWEKP